MGATLAQDAMKAGTGFVVSLPVVLKKLQDKGYTENLSPKFDHFDCQLGKIQLFPKDFEIDEVVRFENASDPDDNAILFAIRSKDGLKGVFIDSFGVYHTDLSPELEKKLRDHPH